MQMHRDADEIATLRAELRSLAYAISHDLSAPVRAVVGYARFFEDEYGSRVDDEGRRLLAIIAGEADRIASMSADLLAFSRLGSAPIENVEVDMSALVAEVIAELALTSDLVSVSEPLPRTRGDRGMLRRVWFALLANARTATRERADGHVTVSASLDADRVVYRVSDNGFGFDMAYAGKLFDMFQKLHQEGVFPGNGASLALTARIVRRHGGSVWAEASAGEGATFFFALPGASIACAG